MASNELVTAATSEPITATEAKLYLKVDDTADDDLIDDQIAAARSLCESLTGRRFIDTTMRLSLSGWPSDDVIVLPSSPLSSVTTVKYIDTDGVLTTLAEGTDYQVSKKSTPGRVKPFYGTYWPALRLDFDPVQVTYVAGYSATAASVPDQIKQAIKWVIGHMYAARTSLVPWLPKDVPHSLHALLAPYKTEVYV